MECSMPGFPVHHQLLKLAQTHVHQVGDAIQPSHPLSVPFSSCLQSFLASGSFPMSQFFRIRWPKYSSFSFSISPSNEYSGLISLRMDWLDLLAVQGTLKNLLQHRSSKASVLQCSDFFIVQLSHQYMTTRKTIALTRWTFFGKVMSLLFNMLSSLVIAFLPRSKHLLISWLQSPSREGNGNPLQYSCLENPMDRGAWWAAVYGVAQSQTRLKQLRSSSSHHLQ